MTSKMNWGVPDWRDSETYPKGDELSANEWRWEFLRRREDYREDWLLHAESSYRNREIARQVHEKGHEYPVIPPDSLGFGAHMPGCEDKYGVCFLLNPASPKFRLGLFPQTYGSVIGDVARGVLPSLEAKGRVAIMFDLNKPLGPQIEQAKRTFTWVQAEFDSVGERRKHSTKWPFYLRVIDARDSGETWEMIGTTLLSPDLESATKLADYDRILDRSGTAIAARAYQVWEQARKLMFNWPA